MIVCVIECATERLRGELTRWLLEVKPGVLVGNVNHRVREKLWGKIVTESDNAIMIFTTNTEQGFDAVMHGEPHRSVVNFDGLKLIKRL